MTISVKAALLFLPIVVFFTVIGTRSYAAKVHGASHRRTRILTLAESCVHMLVSFGITFALWHNRLSPWGIAIWGVAAWNIGVCFWAALTLFNVVKTIRAAKIVLFNGDSPERDAGKPGPPDVTGATRVRFGPHELLMTPDKIIRRRRYALRDSRTRLGLLIFVIAISNVVSVYLGQPLSPLADLLALLFFTASIVGDKVKIEQARIMLEVRGDQVFAEGVARGRTDEITIEVAQFPEFQSIRLVAPDAEMPYVLLLTHDGTLGQAEGIAEAIRTFLKERQTRETWPPAPSMAIRRR